jgi:FixJ family two-component response regulator
MGKSQPRKKPLVAVVDDDESIRDTTKDLLDAAGLGAATFTSAEAFLSSSRTLAISCLIADMRMPGMSGLALHEHLVAAGTPIPTILITAYPEEPARERAFKAGVACYLTKPFAADELLGCVNRAMQTRKSRPAGR